MIAGLEFGWPEGEEFVQCAFTMDAPLSLCGRVRGFVPVDGQPDLTPEPFCTDCRDVMFGAPRSPSANSWERAGGRPVERGTCSACGQDEELVNGRLTRHTYGPGLPCMGVNMRPRRSK